MKSLIRRVAWWLNPARKEAELREELQFHLAAEAQERRDRGLRDEDARSAAQRDLGNEARVREDVRAVWTWRPFDELSQDLRFAWRTMLANRAVTLFAVASLALGIGANTAIYSFMDAVLLRSLPVPDPDSLVVLVWNSKPISRADNQFVLHSISGSTYESGNGGVEARILPYPAFERLREIAGSSLSSIFAVYRGGKMNVFVDGEAELTDAHYVSGEFFRGLAIIPAAGRLLSEEDDRAASPVAVVSAGYAERRLGGIDHAVGRAVGINGHPFTIVGVTPRGFDGVEPGAARQLYLPFNTNVLFEPDDPGDTPRMRDANYYWVEIMGRLRPGVTREQANAPLSSAFAVWVATTATTDAERANLPVLSVADGGGGLDTLKRRYQRPLFLLQAIVALILVIACANTASLLLARSAARHREIALRLSIGAGRFRLIRQLITESVVLAVTGGLFGIALAMLGTQLLSALLANGDDELLLHADVHWNVLMITIALSLVCGVTFGLAPALQSTRPELLQGLKDLGGVSTSRRAGHRMPRFKLQHALIVSQIALLMLLLVGAGLFARTLANLQSVPLGFNPQNVLLFDIDAPQAGHPAADAAAYYAQLLDRFAQIPGVTAATVAHSSLPRAGRGHPISLDGVRLAGTYRILQTGPRFFSTMQIPTLAGREINERDSRAAVAPALISESFARSYLPGQNPIGRHLTIGGGLPMEVEIIGVCAAPHYGPIKRQSPPALYVSYSQVPPGAIGQMTYALRTDADPLRYAAAVRQIVHAAEARIPVTNFRTQASEVASQINQEILLARICGAFAFVALIIACAGLYGTLAYAVARRTKEIGIRIAIGAPRRTVIWMVVREMCALTALGLVISIPIARTLAAFIQSFLFETQPGDPAALGFAVAMLVIAAVAASYGPAYRATRIDPTIALRYE
jgi:macrolide transport system ATP-binding/permease protein